MKKSTAFLLFISAFIMGSQAVSMADLSIQAQASVHDRNMNMNMRFGSGKIRVETEMASIVIVPSEKKTLMIMPQTRQYMYMQSPAASPADGGQTEMPEVVRTGKHQSVSGFNCEQVFIKFKNGRNHEMWISKDGPKLSKFANGLEQLGSSGGSEMGLSWLRYFEKYNGIENFPIQTIVYNDNGGEASRMTVLSFDENPIPDSEFSPPAGYTEQKMPTLPGGMDMKQLQNLRGNSSGGQMTPEQMERMKQISEELQRRMQQGNE